MEDEPRQHLDRGRKQGDLVREGVASYYLSPSVCLESSSVYVASAAVTVSAETAAEFCRSSLYRPGDRPGYRAYRQGQSPLTSRSLEMTAGELK